MLPPEHYVLLYLPLSLIGCAYRAPSLPQPQVSTRRDRVYASFMQHWRRSTVLLLFILLSLASLIRAMQPPRLGMTSFGRRFSATFNTKQTTLQKKPTPAQQALRPRSSDRTSRSQQLLKTTKVVTDIDDTVKSSGGVKLFGIPLGGIDTQFKRGEFYPGGFQFVFELSVARTKLASLVNNVSVLTARAKEFKFALAIKPNDKISSGFRSIGLKNGFKDWGIGDVYYGSVAEWIFQSRKGTRKLENFGIMMNKDIAGGVRAEYIFVGDTGEKDEEAADRIAEKFPGKLRAVFLHVVAERQPAVVPRDRLIQNKLPVMYFRTYVGAAAKAYDRGMISEDALSRVVKQSVADLQTLERNAAKKPLYNKKYRDFASKWRELEADINFANRVAASPQVSSPFVSRADVYSTLNAASKLKNRA